MKTAIRCTLALPMAAFLIVASPAVAGKGGNGHGNGHANGHASGNSHGQANGHSKGGGKGGGGKGTPAPIAGLGVLALGAIGYGSRKLRKHPPK